MNKSKDSLRSIWDTIKWININKHYTLCDPDREKKETETLFKDIMVEHF